MAQYRPDAATLLAAVADVLDDVLPDVSGAKQHQVRVAANLARLVAREAELGPVAAGEELAALEALVGPSDSVAEGTSPRLVRNYTWSKFTLLHVYPDLSPSSEF